MEINIGDYVRTEAGIFYKILSAVKHTFLCIEIRENTTKIEVLSDLEPVVKHSKDIIDLIQKDDYVNGKKVIKTNCILKYVDDDDDYGDSEVNNALDLGNEYIYFNFEIKTIITKEQIEQIEYRIEE